MLKRIGAGLLLIFMCGCLKTDDTVTINADGSGKVHIETVSSLPPQLDEYLGMMDQSGRMNGTMYPPVSEAEAQKFFPGKDFTVSVKQQHADNGNVTTAIDVEFKDINGLLASPYGAAHQLSARIEGGSLVVKGVTGMEAVARYAEMKDERGMGMAIPNMADLQKKKAEMRAQFRITLPNAISAGNGTNAGKTATWLVERAQSKDAEDFANKLGTVSEARCSADGLKFSPVVPVRLALQPFAQLATGTTAATGPGIDTNKIAAAAKFVPYGLSITRSLDLSGAGATRENSAQLIGAIVIPTEYAPQKWGEAKLDEVVDAKGNDLKPANQEEGRNYSMGSRFSGAGMDGSDEATNAVTDQRHVVTLAFRPPDWKVNEIAKIKGTANLQYFGSSQTVVKLTNAIPAKWIVDISKGSQSSFDSSDKTLSSPALTDLGLSLTAGYCMVQSGFTVVSLNVKGKTATLGNAQIFDADGKPWPTIFSQSQEEGSTVQIVVAGKPQPPLSLALVASGAGATVEVPIVLEHVAVVQK